MPAFALIHSPLVGPVTWQPVAEHLAHADHRVVVPELRDTGTGPYWQQHADSAAEAINISLGEPCILVGHSGAGPLLPAIGVKLNHTPMGYIFVDAGIPQPNISRLEMMRRESQEWADAFEVSLKRGERYPNWTETDLRDIIPDEPLRHQLLAELHPRDLAFFTESIVVPGGWDDAHCGYVQLSETYRPHAIYAREAGWPVVALEANHFYMLAEPETVASAILQVLAPNHRDIHP